MIDYHVYKIRIRLSLLRGVVLCHLSGSIQYPVLWDHRLNLWARRLTVQILLKADRAYGPRETHKQH